MGTPLNPGPRIQTCKTAKNRYSYNRISPRGGRDLVQTITLPGNEENNKRTQIDNDVSHNAKTQLKQQSFNNETFK